MIRDDDLKFLISTFAAERMTDAYDALVLLDGKTGVPRQTMEALVALDLIRSMQGGRLTRITQGFIDSTNKAAMRDELIISLMRGVYIVSDQIAAYVAASYRVTSAPACGSISRTGFNAHSVSEQQSDIDEIYNGYQAQVRILGILNTISEDLELNVSCDIQVQPLVFFAHEQADPLRWGGRSGPDELIEEGIAVLRPLRG